VGALRQIWEVSDHLCSKRLKPFLPELIRVLESHGEITLSDEVRARLLSISASMIDRVLKPYRARGGLRRPYTTRRSPGELKALIPIRTFGEWAGVKPGSMQGDLVASALGGWREHRGFLSEHGGPGRRGDELVRARGDLGQG
jgi:hypothetical protein